MHTPRFFLWYWLTKHLHYINELIINTMLEYTHFLMNFGNLILMKPLEFIIMLFVNLYSLRDIFLFWLIDFIFRFKFKWINKNFLAGEWIEHTILGI